MIAALLCSVRFVISPDDDMNEKTGLVVFHPIANYRCVPTAYLNQRYAVTGFIG